MDRVTIHKVIVEGRGFLGYDPDGGNYRVLSKGKDAKARPYYFQSLSQAFRALEEFYQVAEVGSMEVKIETVSFSVQIREPEKNVVPEDV